MSSTKPLADAAMSLEGVQVRRGRRTVLEAISFRLEPGRVAAIFGRNGAGKSSLIRCVAGLAPTAAGTVRVLGLDPWRQRRQLFERMAYVAEVPDAPPAARVAQLVAFDRSVCDTFDEVAAHRRIARAEIPLSARAGELSRGQKTQLGLALALARRPQLLLLDDPTLGLDPIARRELIDELVDELAERGTTVVLTTHDLDLAERLAERLLILANGRLVVDDELDTLRTRLRRVVLEPGAAVPAELRVLAELGADSLGTEVLAVGGELGRDASLSDIVTAHLGSRRATPAVEVVS